MHEAELAQDIGADGKESVVGAAAGPAERDGNDPLDPAGSAAITTMRSARYTASSTSWVTKRMVFARACAMRPISSWSRMRVIESRAPNGSSISRICGSTASARASATRCCIPPESWLGWCPA